MPVFFQQQINEFTRLGIWKIEETEDFFKGNVPLHRDVTHPHKRLQHLAGRFLLQFLFPGFPYDLIQIADTRKPFMPGEEYHFSISHCGDYAAAIVSRSSRVGIDVEIPTDTILRIQHKFITENEREVFHLTPGTGPQLPTIIWSVKEAVFKWYGEGKVDFRQHIRLLKQHTGSETIDCFFEKTGNQLAVNYRQLDQLVLAWVVG
jgi:phosphopantetheinyl transferase